MQADQLLRFGTYRLNPQTGQLWQGKQEMKVTPKAAAVLCQLVTRAGQIVSKEELFGAVWPGTVVSDAALTSCIQELRQALHDPARKPQYIETVHRRGYRFIGRVVRSQEEERQKSQGKRQKAKIEDFPPAPGTQHLPPSFVGRVPDLTFLHERLAKAVSGERQLVFVTGEPGIGKTMLIEVFVSGVRSPASYEESQKSKVKTQKSKVLNPKSQILNPGAWVARGQCIEHYGVGEAYLPILEALGRLCRDETGNSVITLLRQHAPSWLVQMPTLVNPTELEELQRRTAGVTRERMLRELAEALEVITVERPLVLVLEDLHWSDVSTLDLLSMLAHRQERAQLLIIGTYRPVEVLTREHPLKGIKQELQLHGQCEELALDFLSEAAVAEYLTMRFNPRPPHPVLLRLREGQALPQGEREPFVAESVHKLAHVIHQRTDGNPLFMVNVTNELVAREVITQHDGHWEIEGQIADDSMRVPENLRQLIEQQLARVSPDERKVLEAASVAGADFSAAAVAAGTEQTTEAIETLCDALARREQFLRTQRASEWPDGTVAARYGFVHALYQEVLYEQISATRRIRLHRQIGEREEQAYGERAREIAAELAMHFERGRDYERAVQSLQQAAENAVRRSANREAERHLTTALKLLKLLPDASHRTEQELVLQAALGTVVRAIKGLAAPEAGQAYARAWELCQQMGETPHLFPLLFSLRSFSGLLGDNQTCLAQGQQLLALAQKSRDTAQLVAAHYSVGWPLSLMGNFTLGYEVFKQGVAVYDPEQHRSLAYTYGSDPGATCLIWLALDLWFLGYPDQALYKIQEGIKLTESFSHPFSVCFVVIFAGYIHRCRREWRATQEYAEAVITLATEQEFPHWLQYGQILRGRALAEQGQVREGIAEIRRGLEGQRATKVGGGLTQHLADLAEAYKQAGQPEEGLNALVEALALVERKEERWFEAELYRLKGELMLQQFKVQDSTLEVKNPQSAFYIPHSEAEACFQKAIKIARKQQAKSWELRATMSLTRLWQRQSKKKQAHKMLAEVYGWFTEGFDTKDLQEAKALLESLESRV